jgi:MoaA/NifB/PqqE/SkfB family radical SAM enzyme
MGFSLFSKRKSLLCYAPLNNMLIDQEGKVRICCHNDNDFILGRYPEQSLHDIWFGPVRRQMTEQIQRSEVPPACVSCVKNGIHRDSPDSKMTTSESGKRPVFEGYPAQIEFLLSNRCNLACIMCAPNRSDSVKDEDALHKAVAFGSDFMEQLQPFLQKVKFAVFSGGEPFLIPEYRPMWKFLHENNPSAVIYVQTNGTVMNDEVMRMTETYHIQPGISIDALDPAIYRQIRRNGDPEKVMDNIRYFREHSERNGNHMTLMITPMQLNAREITVLLDYCNEHRLLFSLSILNWPYHLAIWALPSESISSLYQEYSIKQQSLKNDHPIAERNNKVFEHFTKLIGRYHDVRREAENRSEEWRQRIREHFCNTRTIVQEYLQTFDKRPETWQTEAEQIHHILQNLTERYAAQLEYPEFVYGIFKHSGTSSLDRLFRENSRDALEKMALARLEELLFLYKNNCYERISEEMTG